ncbi:retrovirus-related pol polyprotein from transposon TNT 1-94 [Tanacetum coccineum]
MQDKNIEISELKKLIEKCKGKSVKTKFDKPSVVRQPNAQRISKPSVLGKPTPFSDSLKRKSFSMTKSVPKTNVSKSLSKPVTTQILPQTTRQAVRKTNVINPGMYRIDTRTTQSRAPQFPQTSGNTNPRMSTSTGVIHRTNVSRPQLRSTQMRDKVVQNNSQVEDKKTEVEDHHMISSISNKTKSITACNDSLKSRTSNVIAVCATCKMMLYEKTSKAWKWWIEQQCPSGYRWVPKTKMKWVRKTKNENVKKRVNFAIDNIVQLILFIVDSGCTKHMTGNLKLLCNFVEKYLGLNHNLFSVGQFCDADLEIAFWKSTCFVRDLQGNDLLTSNRGSDLYTIYLQETTSSTPIYFMARASPTQAWLWHQRLSHLNFDYINLLSKKDVVIGLPKLKYVKDQLCSSCEDETPEVLKDFLKMIQCNLQALVISVQIDRGKKFLNKTLNAYFKEKGIEHQTSTPRTPEQNDVTAYHIINDRKPLIRHLHIFGCTYYLTRDGENLDKMKEKGDPCILVGYSTQSKGYQVYNKRTRLIVESIHIKFDDIKEMTETSVANNTSGLVPQWQKSLDYDNSGLTP